MSSTWKADFFSLIFFLAQSFHLNLIHKQSEEFFQRHAHTKNTSSITVSANIIEKNIKIVNKFKYISRNTHIRPLDKKKMI